MPSVRRSSRIRMRDRDPSRAGPRLRARRAPGGSRGCAGACRRPRTGSRVPRISLARRLVLRLLPAPDGPTASTVTMSDGSMTPAATPGARLRLTVEALQPGAAMRVAPTSRSRCLRAADRQLGDAVRPRVVEVAAVEPVPVGDRLEPVVGAGIDHERGVGERVGVLPGLPVRQREEDDVVPGEHLGRRVLQREVRERAQVRLVLDEGLSRVRVRGDGADLDVGMCGEDPEDLAARIAGCAGDGDRICHGFHLRVWGRGPETATPAAALLRRCAGSPRVGVRPDVGARERRSERASRRPGRAEGMGRR